MRASHLFLNCDSEQCGMSLELYGTLHHMAHCTSNKSFVQANCQIYHDGHMASHGDMDPTTWSDDVAHGTEETMCHIITPCGGVHITM